MRYQTWQQDWTPLIKSEGFSHDATAVAKTSTDDLDKVMAALDAANGFVGPEGLRKLVGSVLTDTEQARGVASFIYNMNSLQRHAGESFLKDFLRDFEMHASLAASDKVKIREALPRLLQKRQPIERHAKADDLAGHLASPLHHLSITCDLRPVFDEKREIIDGMFPVATLKVEVYDAFMPKSVTAMLSGKQIERILEEAGNAQKKVAALHTLLTDRGIAIPEAGVHGATDEDEEGGEST